jgi:hypothetical protein
LLDKFISTHSQKEIKLISTKDQVVHGFTKFLHIKNLNEFKHNREVRLKEGVRTVIQSLTHRYGIVHQLTIFLYIRVRAFLT